MSFLQSPEWEEIQKKMGRPVKRLGPVLVIRHDLPLDFNYLYAPRPGEFSESFFSAAAELIKEGNSLFIKIDPSLPWLPSLGGVPSFSIQPRQVAVVDCRVSEEEILVRMHPKMRYNVRLAAKRGVEVFRVPSAEALQRLGDFLGLVGETAKRDGFSLHSEEHYRILLEVMSGDFENNLWLADFGGRVVGGVVVNFFRPTGEVTYLHGGSSGEHREVMASHLLHWEIIRETRRRGFASYDLGGVDEKRWPGVTRFKKGFGGDIVNFPETRDFVFRRGWYALYALRRRFLRRD